MDLQTVDRSLCMMMVMMKASYANLRRSVNPSNSVNDPQTIYRFSLPFPSISLLHLPLVVRLIESSMSRMSRRGAMSPPYPTGQTENHHYTNMQLSSRQQVIPRPLAQNPFDAHRIGRVLLTTPYQSLCLQQTLHAASVITPQVHRVMPSSQIFFVLPPCLSTK